jgi:hypothetical protein
MNVNFNDREMLVQSKDVVGNFRGCGATQKRKALFSGSLVQCQCKMIADPNQSPVAPPNNNLADMRKTTHRQRC